MADIEKTALLTFEVDQQAAERDLVQTEKNILAVKRQQAELNKEYKAGKVTEDEYVKSNIKLQQSLKKEVDQKNVLNRTLATESNSRNAMRQRVAELTKEYNNLNEKTDVGAKRSKELTAELTKLNKKLNEGSKEAGSFKDNIGNYPQQLGEAAKGANVAGVSIGDLSSKFNGANLAAGATVGILTGLVSLYASSTVGARDFAFAQSQLSKATGLVADGLASLVSNGKDGEGLFSSIVSRLLDTIPALGTISKAMAAIEQNLKDIEISRAFAAGFAKDDEKRAELFRRIRDDEEESFEIRLEASKQIDDILARSGERTVTVIKAQIEAIKGSTIGYENNRDAQLQVAQLTGEIADKEEEITGKLTENVKLRKTLTDQIAALARANRRQVDNVDTSTENPLEGAFPVQLDNELKQQADFNKRIAAMQKEAANEAIRQKNREAEAKAALNKIIAEQELATISGFLGAAMALFDEQSAEYKAFATFQTLISTYSTAQKAYEAAFVPPTVASPALGAANVAIAVAQGLANIAAINGVQFAEGGFTGTGGKFEPAGIVHKGEYVAPQHVVNSPMAQPHINALEGMRTRGYADGGFVTNQNTSQAQQSLLMINAIKNLPQPVLGVEEVTRVQRRIATREKVARI